MIFQQHYLPTFYFMNKYLATLLLMCIVFGGCVTSPYYQDTKDIPAGKWNSKKTLNFAVNITDTNRYYNCYLIVRHTNNYAFSNLWLNVYIKGPSDSNFRKLAVDFGLATPQGQWLGKGMGEIYEQRRRLVLNHPDYKKMPLSNDKTYELIAASGESADNLFHQKGLYQIKIEQNMRENILSDILNIGIRIEKYEPRVSQKKPTSQTSVL